jgi:protoheme IX farnesyltransferase
MLTTSFGYILASGSFTWGIVFPTFGILLLACASAVLNHYQEKDTDAMMERTKSRPIPAKLISEKSVLILFSILFLSGFFILLFDSGILAASLGLLAILWYNGIYTPLKKKTALAIIPGSVIGAIPPVVGWVAGGGNVFDPQIILIAFFFFIWQIPHFWLLLLVFGKDYEEAGFPTLTQIFSKEQLARITFIWTFATAVTSFLLPLFNVIKISYASFVIILAATWLIYKVSNLLRTDVERIEFKYAFREINLFVIYIMLSVSVDRLFIFM